jgi:propanediol dehydratase large subunit
LDTAWSPPEKFARTNDSLISSFGVARLNGAPVFPAHSSNRARRRLLREDVAEALEYGERAMTRTEAVSALQNLGFQKTAAYKALFSDGRFADFLAHTPDGLVEWRG